MPIDDEARAIELGFASGEQMRRAPRRPRTMADFARIPAAARAVRSDAAAAISSARHRGISPIRAALEVGVPLEAIRWWFPDAVVWDPDGELEATASDSATRLRPLAVDGEVTFVPVEGSAEADRVRNLFATQWDFVTHRASAEDLAALPDITIGGRRLERDPQVLEELALRGDFDLDEIYRDLFG